MDTKFKTSSAMPYIETGHIERLKGISQMRIVIVLLFFLVVLGGQKAFSQGVGIGESTFTPDVSAILELKHMSGPFKGFLAPRMTSAERTGIAAPAPGLLVYDTNTKSFWYFDGVWVSIPASALGGPNQLLGMNAAGTENEFKELIDDPNQIIITHGLGTITFSTPQDIHTGASPTFFGLTLSDLDANSGVYTDALSALTSTPPSSGTIGYWDRAGITLSPSNDGDNITTSGDISTTGGGTMTSAGLFTGLSGINVTGTLQADDDVILGSDNSDALVVNATADLKDILNVDGAATLGNTLDVTGATTLTDLTSTGSVILGNGTDDAVTVTGEIAGATPLVFEGAV
ncbi:MAG: hypothetical protein K9H49_05265, partial [Bacteroidales bacterium]|nr:hypothetical protein [Bacteroidales bacterium]